jgi:hypothetical protein
VFSNLKCKTDAKKKKTVYGGGYEDKLGFENVRYLKIFHVDKMFLKSNSIKKNWWNKDGDNGRLYLEHHLDNFVLGGVLAEDAEDVADITAGDLPRALTNQLIFSQSNESLLQYTKVFKKTQYTVMFIYSAQWFSLVFFNY